MSQVLILFSSFDGQTARIAEHIAATLGKAGHGATVVSADRPEALRQIESHQALIVGAAVRYDHHSRALEKFVRQNAGAIAGRPNAFFSVCLSAGGPAARPAAAARYIEAFRARTGWTPDESTSFAGALRYRKYNFLIRFLMRLIVGMAGGETDTSRDYEYTDWQAVERFAAGFASRLEIPAAA
jgi:menaquinone-dependent protoporphyrinogen oxidase